MFSYKNREYERFTASDGGKYLKKNRYKIEALLELGIPITEVIQDGFTEVGYYSFIYDSNGRKNLRTYSNEAARQFNYWKDDDERKKIGIAISKDNDWLWEGIEDE